MTPEVAAAPVASPLASTDSGPYKFLDFYTENDESKFAGRDRDMREVVARITTNKTFVLYARSGLGKTSLLLAGVFPELRRRRFTPVHIRTLGSPLNDLCMAVAAGLETGPIAGQPELVATLRERSSSGTTVLVFDQFEEFFIHLRQDPQQRRDFVRTIAALAADESLHLRIVFSLREDYLAELDEFRDDVEDLFANDYRLKPLTAFGARQAAAQPLIQAGVPFERRLLARLVDLLADVAFDPLMLQILCTEVYRQAAARSAAEAKATGKTVEPRLTEADLDEAGGLEGVIRRYLDRVVREIPANSVLLSRTILDALITQEQTKRAATFETLANAEFSAAREEIERVLEIFVKHRLVRPEKRGGEVWYELTHERLVVAVLEWLKLDQSFFNFTTARNLVANSCRGEIWRSNVETLLAEGALRDVIGPYSQRLRFSPLELEFVFSSAVYRRTPLNYWMSLLGPQKSTELVAGFLQSENATARISGAMASVVPGLGGVLADICLREALSDPVEGVRRAAGRSLGVIGTSSHLAELANALRQSQTRAYALEVVADLRQTGHSIRPFGIVSRLRAMRIAYVRVRDAHAASVRARGGRGALTGLIAAVVWTPAVLLPVLAALNWLTGDFSDWIELVAMSAYLLVLAIALASFLGWRLGRVGALDAALHGEGRWFHAVMRLYLAYVVAGAISIVMLLGSLLSEARFTSSLISLGAVLVPLWLVAGVTRLARPAVWPTLSPMRVWLWGLAASAGVPLVVPAITFSILALFGTVSRGAEYVFVGIGLFLSLCVATAVTTFARTAQPAAAPEEAAATPARLRLAACVAASAMWFVVVYGRDSVPLLAPTYAVREGRPIEIRPQLLAGVADSSFATVSVPNDRLRWQHVTRRAGEIRSDSAQLGDNDLVRLDTGRNRLRMRSYSHTPESELVLRPIPLAGNDVGVSSDALTFVAVEFKRSSDTNLLTATLGGKVAPAVRAGSTVYAYASSIGFYGMGKKRTFIETPGNEPLPFDVRDYVSHDWWDWNSHLMTPLSGDTWQFALTLTGLEEGTDKLVVPLALKLVPPAP